MFLVEEKPDFTLQEYINNTPDLSEQFIVGLLEQIYKILKQLHTLNIAHRDVRSCNIGYFQDRQEWKLINFQFAQEILQNKNGENPKYDIVGSPFYMSSEIYQCYLGLIYKSNASLIQQDLHNLGILAVKLINPHTSSRNSIQPYIQKIISNPSNNLEKLIAGFLSGQKIENYLKHQSADQISNINLSFDNQNCKYNKIRGLRQLSILNASLQEIQLLKQQTNKGLVSTWPIFYESIITYYELEDFNSVLQYCRQAGEILENFKMGGGLAWAATIEIWGISLIKTGKIEEGVAMVEKSIFTKEKILGVKHIEIAQSVLNLSDQYNECGKFQQALTLYKKSLEIYQFNIGYEHIDLIPIMKSIGICYWKLNDFDLANEYLLRSLDLTEKYIGPRSEELSQIQINLASVMESQKQFRQALDYYEKATLIIRSLYGENSIQFSRVLLSKIFTLMYLKEFKKAYEQYDRIYQIYKLIFGQQHNETAILLFNMSFAAEGCQEFQKAYLYTQQSINIIKQNDPSRAQRWQGRLEELKKKSNN